jgi:hypothetical protein
MGLAVGMPARADADTYGAAVGAGTHFIVGSCSPAPTQDSTFTVNTGVLTSLIPTSFITGRTRKTLQLIKDGNVWVDRWVEDKSVTSVGLGESTYVSWVNGAGLLQTREQGFYSNSGYDSTVFSTETLDLNTGAYTWQRVIINGNNPFLPVDCQYRTAKLPISLFLTSAPRCTAITDSRAVFLEKDGQGGALRLTLTNATTEACTILVAPHNWSLVVTDASSGAIANGWTLPPGTQVQSQLNIRGGRNFTCSVFALWITLYITHSGEIPNHFEELSVLWAPQPSTFDPNTGMSNCPSEKTNPPVPPATLRRSGQGALEGKN